VNGRTGTRCSKQPSPGQPGDPRRCPSCPRLVRAYTVLVPCGWDLAAMATNVVRAACSSSKTLVQMLTRITRSARRSRAVSLVAASGRQFVSLNLV
jgi:hypothetical protein